jgi:pyruvate dehydrogenase E2 component (dihydrolipoamide acetyltransferase)
MATEIMIPRLGWTMEEGIFGEWLKQDGDAIAVGDLLYTIETDKATQEVESLDSGLLRIAPDGPKPGDTVLVGQILGYLLAVGEPSPYAMAAADAPAPVPAQPAATPTPAVESAPAPAARRNGPAISPRARRVAGELNVDWSLLAGSGRTGRIVERDVRAAALQPPAQSRLLITPVARRLAEDAGIDPAALTPQKPGARIQREDVEAAIAARAVTPPAEEAATPPRVDATVPAPATTAAASVPVTRVRRLIAQRMAASAQTTASVTLISEADATDLVALREQLKATFGPRNLPVPSYNDLLIKLTAVALQTHPLLNATWNESEIVLHEQIHMGLAVDSADGLLVPVVRDVQSKSLRRLAAETQSLIEKAQSHRLGADDLQGGTFTITNLGMYGIDAFTPLINLPQTAILGIGRIQARPAVVNDQVVPRKLMTLSLTFDHRVVDGGPAARFLNLIREFIEEPTLWLVE